MGEGTPDVGEDFDDPHAFELTTTDAITAAKAAGRTGVAVRLIA